MTLEIEVRDPRDPDVTAILQTHQEFCRSSTPTEHVHALEVSKLTTPDVTVFGGKLDGELVAVGAIRILEATHAELKSMHTLLAARGITHLSLETGTSDAFKSARMRIESV